ncbi:hypothetical protein [Nonomuraea pusilla]|uniref:Uncharacterized protein n=1 Tax=Nonomuraea pusilla TaxID=46177 RepID=A0A1H8K6K7_9ACTN|nr:hypothetical protein [Nonomuraea pusilla]SEN88679.1 hypothetical protein SAMN05660976_08538 [Nonomuraea pusilla]
MTDVFQRREGGFEFISEDAVLTPADTDVFLKRLNNELARAQLNVMRARDAEVQAEKAYMEARTKYLFDSGEEPPEVGRRAGQVSQKQADEWFAVRISAEYWALREARVVRTNAVDYAWQVKTQVELMRSLNVNAKALYDTPSGGGR